MKVLVASDKFKGSLTALEACLAIKEGVLKYDLSASVVLLPLADGGEGSLEAIEGTLQFKREFVTVNNPIFKHIDTFYGLKGDTAYIEMSKASGLLLLKKDQQSACHTTTLGTGEMIKDALKKGAKKIYLFIGGSATNDAGIGMAQALGYNFLDKDSLSLKPVGASLEKIEFITGNLISEAKQAEFIVVTDVKNMLYGNNGAAHIFAKQKGATDLEIKLLDKGLKHFSNTVEKKWGKNIANIAGAGAAGGLGAGAVGFLNARIKPGIETILDLLEFNKILNSVDYVITGEGKLDYQTLEGKVIKGVMDLSNQMNKPLGIVCGVNEISSVQIKKLPIKVCCTIMDNTISIKTAMSNAYSLLVQRATQVTKLMAIEK